MGSCREACDPFIGFGCKPSKNVQIVYDSLLRAKTSRRQSVWCLRKFLLGIQAGDKLLIEIERSTFTFLSRPGRSQSHFFVLETDKFLYYVSYVDLPAGPQTPEENKTALDASRDHALANYRLISENDITLDGIVGRELLVDRNGLILKGRFFMPDNASIT